MTPIYAPKSSLSLLIVLGITALLSGCQKEQEQEHTGTFCAGGFVRTVAGADPVCEGLCDPSLCQNPNNVCVDNKCVLQCTSHADCALRQDCVAATEDGSGASVTICRANGKSALGTACPSGNECANLMACGDGSPCPLGGNCAVGTCRALVCNTTGFGDTHAYCTLPDCQSNDDCPGGYECRAVRVSDQICGKSQPPENICGTTPEDCVDPARNAANGTTFAQGEICTLRNKCQLREPCDSCTTDFDCSRVPGQRCVDGSCAAQCGSDADCRNGFQCTSGACVPRSGTCASPTGQGQLCDTCRADTECGPGMFCASIDYGGMRVCLLKLGISCQSDADCPASRTGMHAACDPGGSNLCLSAPLNVDLNLTACWCQNKGASCSAAGDCCSGSCEKAEGETYGVCQ